MGSQRLTRDLREALPFTASAKNGKRVDREKKIIYGVKMVGSESPNRHGVDGVQGTDYLYSALTQARPMYESASAYENHPPRDNPDLERDIDEALGVYHNVEVKRNPEISELGEVFGDLHLLPNHPLTESLLDAAERDDLAGVFKLSHNASGQGSIRDTSRGKRYVIEAIDVVRSCDVVTRGATTKNFFESREARKPMPKKKLETAILESKLEGPIKAKLLELDDLMGQEYTAPDDGAAETGHEEDLVNAVAKLVKSKDPADHKMAMKLLKMLKPDAELEESDDEPADDKSKQDKDVQESIAATSELYTAITGKEKPRKSLIESLAKLPMTDRIATIRELAGVRNDRGGNSPPPGGLRDDQKTQPAPANVMESKEVQDFMKQAMSVQLS